MTQGKQYQRSGYGLTLRQQREAADFPDWVERSAGQEVVLDSPVEMPDFISPDVRRQMEERAERNRQLGGLFLDG